MKLSLILFLAAAAFAGMVEDLKPGHWYEVPNSKLYDVRADETQFASALCGGIEGIGGIINDWCSGAMDTYRSRLLIGPGGGHNGYSGNEVYAFDLNTLQWTRLTDPNPLTSCSSERPDPNLYPGAMHTYDGLEYMPPPLDRHFVADMWGGSPVRNFYSLNMTTLQWTAHSANAGVSRTGDVCVYDTATRRIFFGSAYSGQIVEWDPVADLCQRKFSAGPFYYQNAVVEPKRHLFVSVGNNAATHAIPITSYPAAMADRTITPGGDNEFQKMVCPGLDYDAVSDKLIGWGPGTGVSKFDVYSLDLDENRWSKHQPSPANAVTPGDENQWGTWGRFKYVPAKNIFIVYNEVRQNVYLYRFTSWRDTVAIDSLQTFVESPSIELYLTTALTVKAFRRDGLSDTVTNSCMYISLDPDLASVSGYHVTALDTGAVRIEVRKSTAKGVALDTISLTILPSTATPDSIRIAPSSVTVLAGDAYALKTIGYFYKNGQAFTRFIDTAATWTSQNGAAATVSRGVITGIAAGGPVAVVAVMAGKSDTVMATVQTKPAFIKRINFQVSSTPWSYGWLADNGQTYTAGQGYGWNASLTSTARDDRNGNNFLLKSFVTASTNSFRISAPDGNYIVKMGMGDNVYGTASVNWTSFGTDTICRKPSGQGNTVSVDTIAVAGGSGALFVVNGPINYIVLISNEGIDINTVAWDDGASTPLPMAVESPAVTYEKTFSFRAYPNPFHGAITFEAAGMTVKSLGVYSLQGRKIADLSGSLKGGKAIWKPAAGRVTPGVYVARLVMGRKVFCQKLIMVN